MRKVRNALMKSLALNLIVRGKIKTTLPKAKELRPFVEKLVSQAKKGDTATFKLVMGRLMNRRPETNKLFKNIAPKYKDRKGGYTRVLKMGLRKADGAPLAMIEFI